MKYLTYKNSSGIIIEAWKVIDETKDMYIVKRVYPGPDEVPPTNEYAILKNESCFNGSQPSLWFRYHEDF